MEALDKLDRITGNVASAAGREGPRISRRIDQRRTRLDDVIEEETRQAPPPPPPPPTGMDPATARQILGVSTTAPFAEIRLRYRFLATKFHPDKVAEKEKAQANEYLASLNAAYKALHPKK